METTTKNFIDRLFSKNTNSLIENEKEESNEKYNFTYYRLSEHYACFICGYASDTRVKALVIKKIDSNIVEYTICQGCLDKISEAEEIE